MKMGELLSELKKEQGDLERLHELRKETFWVEKGKKPVVSMKEMNGRIKDKMRAIRRTKLCIQERNLKTKINDISLAEAILKIADLRSEISHLRELRERSDRWSLREEKETRRAQLDPLQLEKMIEALQKEKTRLDAKIQSVNWRTATKAT